MTTYDATLAELNERYKDKPVSEATYEIDGQPFAVTSHYVGEKSLDKELYRMAFERAYAETVGLDHSQKREKRTCHIRFSAL